MLKELWTLIRMMFSSRPSNIIGKPLDLVVMKHFPFKGFTFMSWCGKVICRQEKQALLTRFLNTTAGKYSQIHEYGHAVQAESEYGDNWFRYYLSYFWHWLLENPISKPALSAYYTNRYEVEAYAQERNADYWVNYSRTNLCGKYTIQNGKKMYKQIAGSNPSKWKDYVKTI